MSEITFTKWRDKIMGKGSGMTETQIAVETLFKWGDERSRNGMLADFDSMSAPTPERSAYDLLMANQDSYTIRFVSGYFECLNRHPIKVA